MCTFERKNDCQEEAAGTVRSLWQGGAHISENLWTICICTVFTTVGSEWQRHKQIFRYKPTEQSNLSLSLEQLTIPFRVKLMIHIYYPGAMGTWHAWWWGELLLCVYRWQCMQLGTYTTWPFTHINYYIISFFWSRTWPWWNFNSTDRFVMFVVFSHYVVIVVLLICYRFNGM